MMSDVTTNDIMKNDIMTNDAMTNDIMTNDVMTNDALFTEPVQAWWHRYQRCGTGAKLDIGGEKLALAITITPVPF